jgi:hypothetical protein
MKSPIIESGMSFLFSDDAAEEKLDSGRADGVVGLKLVDFIFRYKNETIFLEVKGSMNASSSNQKIIRDHKKFLEKVKNGKLAEEELVPKCRGSYLFLHLMDELGESVPAFAVLLEPFDTADLIRIKDKIERLLAKEARTPWKKKYAKLLGVFNRKAINRIFGSTLTVT